MPRIAVKKTAARKLGRPPKAKTAIRKPGRPPKAKTTAKKARGSTTRSVVRRKRAVK